MLSIEARNRLSIAAGLLALFLIVAFSDGVVAGLWFIGCWVAGWLNILGTLQTAISWFRGYKPNRPSVLLSLFAVIASTAIILLGYGLVLLVTTGMFLLLNAIVLKFNAVPVGARYSEP